MSRATIRTRPAPNEPTAAATLPPPGVGSAEASLRAKASIESAVSGTKSPLGKGDRRGDWQIALATRPANHPTRASGRLARAFTVSLSRACAKLRTNQTSQRHTATSQDSATPESEVRVLRHTQPEELLLSTQVSAKTNKHDVKDLSLAAQGERRVAWATESMPVLQTITKRFATRTPAQGFARRRVSPCDHRDRQPHDRACRRRR